MKSLWTQLSNKVHSFWRKCFADLVFAEQAAPEHAVEKSGRYHRIRHQNVELGILITHDVTSQAWLKAIKNLRESIVKR